MSKEISDYNISPDVLLLNNKMDSILETVVGVYESYGVPLPTRRYWTFGRPAEDCAQVVVYLAQAYLGSPGDQATTPRRCSDPKSLVINIAVTRDFPIGVNGKAVSAEKIIEANRWNAVDTQVLLEALYEFDKWSDGGPGLGIIATVNANDAGGGLSTVNMNLTIALG